MTSERFERLETALAHAEATVEELSDELRRQGDEIDRLRLIVGRLTRSLAAMAANDEPAPPADRPPPHW